MEGLPNLQRWLQQVKERPSFHRGADVPDPSRIYNPPTEEEMEKGANASRAWIMRSMTTKDGDAK